MSNEIDFRPVILAGGSGTRFWPRSRRARAKQVLAQHNVRIFKEEDRRTGTFQGRSAYVHDPDRNVIEIIDHETGPVYETQEP